MAVAKPAAKPGGLVNRMAESILRPMVVEVLDRYSHDREGNIDVSGLKAAILLNRDLYKLWVDNCEREGVPGPDTARHYTRLAPDAKGLLTPENVRKWLLREKKYHIIKAIDSTTGGSEWLEWNMERLREELWR